MALKRYERGEGKDWNVKGEIAYGKGDVHKEFQALQVALNDFATRLGFDKLEVDGFLGPRSVTSFQRVYDAVIQKNPLLAATPFPVPKTKEEIAEYAAFIRQWLQTTAEEALTVGQAGA